MKTFQLPTINLWNQSKGEAESECTTVVEQQSKEKCKNKIHILNILNKICAKLQRKGKVPDTPDAPVILDFNQNVEQNHLSEASQQLLAQEDHLFRCQSSDAEVTCTEDEEDSLQKNYETLMLHLRMAVNDSFNKENQEKLRSAVMVIHQQEEKDRHWEKATEEKGPCWRPLRCKEIHDMLLKELIEVRLQQANKEENGADNLSTSLKREVCRMGKRIQKDLLQVVQDVQQCYTSDFDICNMYVQLYHQAFSAKLTEFAQTNLDIQDCTYILRWIHVYYPKDILKQNELAPHIKTESLGALLTEEARKALEEQYLSHKEMEVRTWLSNALKKEEEIWQTSNKPALIDGFPISTLAVDLIPIINGSIKETVDILGNRDNGQRILVLLESFLMSYKKSLTDPKGKHINLPDILKASLFSIKQFREYIEKQENLPDDKKAALLSIVSEMRNFCHSYFLSPIHKKLKDQYRKLWTQTWLSESQTIVGELISTLEDMVQDFSDIQTDSMKELLSQLHSEVMTEYVKRMLKVKLKLKDKDDQEAAAGFLCEDSVRINSLFIRIGSEEKWLSSILPKISEVVRLQDSGALQLEIVTLAQTYPDISECQVVALLDLKANLSKAEVRNIKKSLNENRNLLNTESTAAFFCKVPVKKNLRTVLINK
ncbi:tumor necrosis factor alpha-induced protein 2-like [Tachysurus fulvidraco]|uniref:tumor necrosis factor alpha-induced protein 2-like n=1 Tax=Tachysurus fulvidraco TaxID=1234273 RepID=UPI001FED2D97|nr:tumor necrosis factor alpha-induced protein 2-like [Tachysurus fulvidraco]